MHTQEQRQEAVGLFLATGSYSATINALSHGSRWTIDRRLGDFRRQDFVKGSRTRWFKSTEEQEHTAVSRFLDDGRNASETVRALGYLSRTLLSA